MDEREIEVKLCVRSLEKIEKRLQELGALLIQPRVLEVNRRYDRPDGSLERAGQVLRIRQDAQASLTYKGKGRARGAVLDRTELEISISDAETAHRILEALGFVQVAIYEKYRRVYALEPCHIMLDELPYGDFVEIEGPDESSIQELAKRLGLNIEHAAAKSYLGIFERYCAGRELDPATLTFESLEGFHPSADDLGLKAADDPGDES